MSEKELEFRKHLNELYRELYKPQITNAVVGLAMSVLASGVFLKAGLTLDNGGYPIISGLILTLGAVGAVSAGSYIYQLFGINKEIKGTVDRQTEKAFRIEAERQMKQSKDEMIMRKVKELDDFVKAASYPGFEEDLETLSALTQGYDAKDIDYDAYLGLLSQFEAAVIYKAEDMRLDAEEAKGSR